MSISTSSIPRRPLLQMACLAIVLAALAAASQPANAGSPLHLRWEELSTVAGKTVSIAMPGGAVVTGRAIAVDRDALLVDIRSTTDAKTWPKGPARIPRASVHRFDMRTKGKTFRILGTALGSGAGLVVGAVAAFKVTGILADSGEQRRGAAALIGIWGAGTVTGYLAGNAADRRWMPVEIVP